MNIVFFMRGVSCSGKSSYLKSLGVNPSSVISTDQIRQSWFGDIAYQRENGKVFEIADDQLTHRLKSHSGTTFVDATNLSLHDTRRFFDTCRKFYAYAYIIDFKSPPMEELMKRNQERYEATGVFIPEVVLAKQLSKKINCEKDFHKFIVNNRHWLGEYDSNSETDRCIIESIVFNTGRSLESDLADCWAIGDVHGCAEEFRVLCEKIREENPSANIFQVGDLIDRGPFFKEVFDVVEDFDIELVMGNHEMNFLQEAIGVKKCRSNARKESLDQYHRLPKATQDRIMWAMSGSANSLILEDLNGRSVLLSHSHPTKPNVSNLNGWTNALTSDNEIPKHIDFKKMAVVHGHIAWAYTDIHEQIRKKNVLNIDSGCVYGNGLTAVRLDLQKVIQVPSLKKYYEMHQ